MAERRGTSDRRTSDRRRSLRTPIDCQIRLLSAATPSCILSGNLLDASNSGIRLILAHSIDVGEKLLIEARRGSRVVCNITVQVVWVESDSSDEFRVGCESLTELSPRQLNQLKSATAEPVVRT
ncbi:MAG: PilZ domain-containing protein [Planctomycetaceae bacterium]